MFLPKHMQYEERLVRCRVCHHGPARRRHMVKQVDVVDGPVDLWICCIECRNAWYVLCYTKPYQTLFKQGVNERAHKLSDAEAYEAAGADPS